MAFLKSWVTDVGNEEGTFVQNVPGVRLATRAGPLCLQVANHVAKNADLTREEKGPIFSLL
jgi:hypothetical protein